MFPESLYSRSFFSSLCCRVPVRAYQRTMIAGQKTLTVGQFWPIMFSSGLMAGHSFLQEPLLAHFTLVLYSGSSFSSFIERIFLFCHQCEKSNVASLWSKT